MLLADAHAHAAFGRRDRQLAIAELTHQVERLLRLLLPRQPQRVLVDVALHGVAHRRRRLEVAVRGHQARQRLVRTVEVVVVDEVTESPLAVRVVGEDRARQHLVPQGLPEALDLAKRLRMLRPALDVSHAVATHPLLERRLAAPRRVLPALVRQHLARRAVLRRRALERFEHELRALVVCEREADHVARVVVHEGDEVQPLVTPKQECEEVRLPQLIRRSALESSRRPRPAVLLGRRRVDEPLLVQHASHRRLRHAQALVPCELVPHATRTRFRVKDRVI